MSTRTSNILKAIVFLVLGILLCCSIINPSEMLNWMIAISLLIAGTILIASSLALTRALVTDLGVSGGFLVAVGVYMIPSVGGGIGWDRIIAITMMVIGTIFILDAIIGFFTLKNETVRNVIVLIFGCAIFAIGICLWLISEFTKFAGLMLGIFFIIYSVFSLISLIIKKDLIVVQIKSTKK